MPEQIDLGLNFEPVALPPARPELVLRWRGGGVEMFWPEFRLVSWCRDWPTALSLALPLGLSNHVRVRVRS
jgi:hypothetical protein